MSYRGEKSKIAPKIQDDGLIFFCFSWPKIRYGSKELPYRKWCLLPVCDYLSLSFSIRLYYKLVFIIIKFSIHLFGVYRVNLDSQAVNIEKSTYILIYKAYSPGRHLYIQ